MQRQQQPQKQQKQQIGIAGEVRCVLRKADGTIKTDTGFQKNLVLDNGLDFFGETLGAADMMAYCVIGSGSSVPSASQSLLDAYVAGVMAAYTGDENEYGYTADGSGFYKISRTVMYEFTGLANQNVSELGLANRHTNSSDYGLRTRALIKDSLGVPTSMTPLDGEVLSVHYRLWQVFSTEDFAGQINIIDGKGGAIPYAYISRLGMAGASAHYAKSVGRKFVIGTESAYSNIYNGEIGEVQASPVGASIKLPSFTESDYVLGSYEKIITFKYPLSTVMDIRSVGLATASNGIGYRQIRYGSVADDSPIPKTAAETIEIPLKISWGRYEGALDEGAPE